MLQMIDTAREGGLHVVGAIQRVPILKARKVRPVRRGGEAADRRAARHVDGRRHAERAEVAARRRSPEARGVRELAAAVARLAGGMDPAMLLAAVDRGLAKASR